MATVLSKNRVRMLIQAWKITRRRPPSGRVLHSAARISAILDRERMRSERGRAEFSLLTLTFPNPLRDTYHAPLLQILDGRLRLLDEVGLLERRRLGIVLPETPAAGAWKLCDDLCALLPANLGQPDCQVYGYPAGPSRPETDPDHSSAADDSADDRGTRQIEELFVQPLPLGKRALDVAGAMVGLAAAAPLLAFVGTLIKLTSPGPVFFRQRRHSAGGRPFTIYKFRTMCVNAEWQKAALRQHSEQDGPAFKMALDPRVTRLGRILRKTSIDELPQLFNVLKGDMSLVGPRPLPCDESDQCLGWQRRRLDVTPGLTCIWQIHGRSKVTFAEWVRMDVRYIRSRSFANDLKLIAQTLPAVLLSRGAC